MTTIRLVPSASSPSSSSGSSSRRGRGGRRGRQDRAQPPAHGFRDRERPAVQPHALPQRRQRLWLGEGRRSPAAAGELEVQGARVVHEAQPHLPVRRRAVQRLAHEPARREHRALARDLWVATVAPLDDDAAGAQRVQHAGQRHPGLRRERGAGVDRGEEPSQGGEGLLRGVADGAEGARQRLGVAHRSGAGRFGGERCQPVHVGADDPADLGGEPAPLQRRLQPHGGARRGVRSLQARREAAARDDRRRAMTPTDAPRAGSPTAKITSPAFTRAHDTRSRATDRMTRGPRSADDAGCRPA